MSEELEKLIELADRALEANLRSSEAPELIEAYAEAFSKWESGHKKLGSADEARLKELSAKHAALIGRLATMKEATAGDIRRLKLKGKGILAYTDILPKKISVTRKRKG